MTPFEALVQNILTLNAIDIWFVAKIFVLAAMLLYIIFSFLVLKEVNLMNKTIVTILAIPLKIAAFGHLIISLAVFVLGLFIL